LNSEVEELRLALEALSFVPIAGWQNDPGVDREILLLGVERDDANTVEGTVRDVEVDVSDTSDGEGEILGREVEGGAGGIVIVTGSPRSFKTSRILVKSASL
jgi:hypothetical protein